MRREPSLRADWIERIDRRPSNSQLLWCSLPPIALAALVLLPFWGKPFTIDDVTFLLEAKHVLRDALHPAAFDMVFHGERIRLSRELATGPVMAYLLVPVVQSRSAEVFAHTIQFLFLIIASISTASLAMRLGLGRNQAGVASLLLVVSPAVLAMTTTAMPDVPAMALGAAGVERFVAWYESRSRINGIVAAILLALAVLSRSHAVTLIPLAGLLAWSRGFDSNADASRERVSLSAFVPLVAAIALVAVVIYVTRDPARGVNLAQSTAKRVELRAIGYNLPSYVLHWALLFPLAVLWPAARWTCFFDIRRSCVSLTIAFVLAITGRYFGWGLSWGVALLFLLTLSIDVLLDVLLDALRRSDRVQLALLLWLLAPGLAAIYMQLPAKLLLFAAPAMAILIARVFKVASPQKMRAGYLGVVTAGCLVLAILIMTADKTLAQIGKDASKVVASEIRAGNAVWADGAWGFQWYAMEAGATPLAGTAPFPKKGDVVVSSLEGYLMPRKFPSSTLISRKVFTAPGGRVHTEGAGFYTNVQGPLPWVWGTRELGRIEVWRVDSDYR